MIAMAEAEQEKLRKEGVGRAAAVEAEGRAEAAKIEAIGLAQAKAIEAQGVAEATAILRKAEAWKEFNDAARLQTILEKLPAIIEASTGVFGAVAAPIGNIDKLVVIDRAGNGENGSGSLARLAKTSPAVVFNLLQQLEALGLNVPDRAAAAGDQSRRCRKSRRGEARQAVAASIRGAAGSDRKRRGNRIAASRWNLTRRDRLATTALQEIRRPGAILSKTVTEKILLNS